MMKILHNLAASRTVRIVAGTALVITLFFLFSDTAFAQATEPKGDSIELIILKVISTVLGGINRLLWPVIMLTGSLLDNEILFGGGMEGVNLSMWGEIRNIVNIVFAVALVGIALYNVLGLGGESPYQIKTILPKFIIGLIAVNFSFLAMKVMLDAVNVGTTAMFGLPKTLSVEVAKADAKGEIPLLNNFCKVAYAKLPKEAEDIEKFFPKSESSLCLPGKDDTGEFVMKPTPALKEMFKEWNPRNASAVMALELLHIAEIDKVVVEAEKLSAKSLAINVITTLFLYIIYGSAFIALFILLLIRVVVLWLALVLSPLFILKFVFPNLLEKAGGGEFVGKVVKTAIAPMIVGFVMSVGFILMSQFRKVSFASGNFSVFTQNTLGFDLPLSGLDTFQDLIIAVGTIAFIWVGVTAAMKDTVGGGITEAFLNTVKSGATWMATAPFRFTRFVPVTIGGKQEKVSPAEIFSLAQAKKREIERAPEERAQELGEKMGLLKQRSNLPSLRKALEDGKAEQGLWAIAQDPRHGGDYKQSLIESLKKDKSGYEKLHLKYGEHKDLDGLIKALEKADRDEANKIIEKLYNDNRSIFDTSAVAPAGTAAAGEESAKPAAESLVAPYEEFADTLNKKEREAFEKIKSKLSGKSEDAQKKELAALSGDNADVYKRLQALQKSAADISATATDITSTINTPNTTLKNDTPSSFVSALNTYAANIADPAARSKKIAELIDTKIAAQIQPADRGRIKTFLQTNMTGLSKEAGDALAAYTPKT